MTNSHRAHDHPNTKAARAACRRRAAAFRAELAAEIEANRVPADDRSTDRRAALGRTDDV